jgi:hypothetical protein
MKANLNIEKKTGDIIISTENSKKGQIIEIDKENDKAHVYYDSDDTKEWVTLKGNNYFSREYKIMNLTQHQNVLLAELSHVEKMYDNDLNCYSNFSLTNAEYILIPINNEFAQDLIQKPVENKHINFIFFFFR